MGWWMAALSFHSGVVEPLAARLRPHAAVLARRWRTVVGSAAGAVMLASVVCLLLPARYTATSRLRVEPTAASADVDVPDEVGLLGSRILVAEVIRQLGLDHDPEFVNGGRRVGWLEPAARVLKRLRRTTRPATDSPAAAD